MSRFNTVLNKLAAVVELRARRKALEAQVKAAGNVTVNPNPPDPPAWSACTLASCWAGSNASQRRMNMLSPGMPDATFDAYLKDMLANGCNTAHVFVANRADGEYSGYCIYGSEWSWTVNPDYAAAMLNRIEELRAAGLAVVLWLMADDSAAYAKTCEQNFAKYVSDLSTLGFFRNASIVVVGLELDEYWSKALAAGLAAAVREVCSLEIGTHQTSGKYDYAPGVADIVFYQVHPGLSLSAIEAEARKVRAATGLPLNFFELSRSGDRERCKAAFVGGAYAVGNWAGGPIGDGETFGGTVGPKPDPEPEPDPPPEPEPDPEPQPPSAKDEFSWVPEGNHITVTLPSWMDAWQAGVFSHHARVTIWSDKAKRRIYTIPISADAIRNRAKADQAAAGKKSTGAVNFFVNTGTIMIPATGRKYAGYAIADPRKTYRGESSRVVTPDGPNYVGG